MRDVLSEIQANTETCGAFAYSETCFQAQPLSALHSHEYTITYDEGPDQVEAEPFSDGMHIAMDMPLILKVPHALGG